MVPHHQPARAAVRWMAARAALSEMVVVVVARDFGEAPAAAAAGDGRNGGPAGSLALRDGTEAHMGHNIPHTAHSSHPERAGGPSAGDGEHPGETADEPVANAAERKEDGVKAPAALKFLDAWVDAVVEVAPAVPAAAAVEEEQEEGMVA